MTLAIITLVFIWIIYHLLCRGLLWKLILAIFGFWGLSIAMGMFFPSTVENGIIAFETLIPWCWVVPTIIVLLAAAYTRELE